MNGTAAVLPHFRRQGRGILINNIGGFAPVLFAAAYAASKFGLRGFTAACARSSRTRRASPSAPSILPPSTAPGRCTVPIIRGAR